MNILKRETIRDGSLVSRVEGLMATESLAGTFLVDSKGGKLYKLNASGSAIWDLLDSPIHPDDLCRRLMTNYCIEADAVRQDVMDLLEELLRRRLIRVSDAPPS